MNYYKNSILANDEEIKRSLSRRDVEEINSIKKNTVKSKEVRQAIKEKKDIESQNRIEDIVRETKEMNEESTYLQSKMQNAEIECQNAKLKRYSKFIDKLNINQEKEIDKYIADGEKFRKRSRRCAIITAMTSVVGAFIQQCQATGDIKVSVILMSMVLGYVIIKMSTSNNDIVNNVNTLLKRFTGTDPVSKITNYLSFIIMGTVITYSIFTNYYTYSNFLSDEISVYICCVFFDIMAIWYSLVADKYEKLDFSEKYKSELLPNMETQNTSNRHVKNTSNDLRVSTRQTTSNEGKKGIYDTSSSEDLETQNTSNLKRTGVTKEVNSKEELQSIIDVLEDGTMLSPSLFNLQNNKNYYNWIKQCANVKKVGNRYVKQTNDKIFTIVPKQN